MVAFVTLFYALRLLVDGVDVFLLSRYEYARVPLRFVKIEREKVTLLGTLDDYGEFQLSSTSTRRPPAERDDLGLGLVKNSGPLTDVINWMPARPQPVYEYRWGNLIPGVMNEKGYFVPQVGEKVIAMTDYRMQLFGPRIWNLPGVFEIRKAEQPRPRSGK